MRYVYEGEQFRIPIFFRDAFNAIIPDLGSVNLTIYNSEGDPIVEEQNLDPNGGTHLVYEVTTGEALELIPGTIATRYQITARYTYNGGLVEGRDTHAYTVIKFAAHGATEEDVRSLLGLTVVEMPNSGVDIDLAYLNTAWDVGPEAFEEGLKAGDQRSEGCRGAVVARAAQELLPGLRVRLAQEVVDGSRQFARAEVDFKNLSDHVADVYAYNLARLQGAGTGEPPLGNFVLSLQPDPFTGA